MLSSRICVGPLTRKMVDAMNTKAMLEFTSKLTDVLKTQFLQLLLKNFNIDPALVPPTLYYLKKLERFSQRRLEKTTYSLKASSSVCTDI